MRRSAGPGDRSSTEKHVAAFDKRFEFRRNFSEHDARFGIVGKPARVETILQ
jgi:hypothetical protein